MQVIEEDERIQPAKDLDGVAKRGEDLNLPDDEKGLTPSLPLSRTAPFTPPPAEERERSGLARGETAGRFLPGK